MSRREKNMMPQSSAGLMRYFDQSKESIKIKPEHVLVACAFLIAFEIILRFIA